MNPTRDGAGRRRPGPRPERGSRLDRALAQAPALAAAALLQAALLFFLLLTEVPASVVPLGQRLGLAVGIACLVLAELGLAIWLNAGLELAVRRLGGLWLDLVKAGGLAALLGLSAASVIKYHATGVHLRRTDLWFGWHSRRQILQEALAGETRLLLLFTGATLAAGTLVFVLLRRWRGRRRPLGPLPVAALTLAAAVGAWGLYGSSPTAQRFGSQVTPEGHWLASRAAARFRPRAAVGEAADHLGEPITAYRPERSDDRPNVILILLESVPWKRTPWGGGPAGLTPNLERLAAESLLFSHAYTTSTHSDYAQMSVLSSLHPRKYDRHDYYARIEYPRTLIWDALAAAGYATAMFSSQNERWGNMLGFLDTPGLQLLRHSLDWPEARHRGSGPESKVYDETPVAAWLSWRRRLGRRPYFTYLNFQANHFPYEIPAEAPHPYAPWRIDFPASFFSYPRDKVPVLLNRFNNALAYSDAQVGRVIDELRRAGEWQRTVLVVASDHGEAFYEHGQPTHGPNLYEEVLRSLLLVRLPEATAERRDEPVSLLDVAPALLDRLGLPAHGNFQGRSDILEPGYSAAGRPLFFTIQGMTAEDGVLLDGWKYLVNWDSGGRRLFHLPSDPEERRDRSEETERAQRLERVLREFLGRQLAYYSRRGWQSGRYPPRLP